MPCFFPAVGLDVEHNKKGRGCNRNLRNDQHACKVHLEGMRIAYDAYASAGFEAQVALGRIAARKRVYYHMMEYILAKNNNVLRNRSTPVTWEEVLARLTRSSMSDFDALGSHETSYTFSPSATQTDRLPLPQVNDHLTTAAEGGRDTRCAESLTKINSELAAALEDTSNMVGKLKIAENALSNATQMTKQLSLERTELNEEYDLYKKSTTEKIMTQDRKYSADIGAAEGGRDTTCAESLSKINSELAAALDDTSTMAGKLKIAENALSNATQMTKQLSLERTELNEEYDLYKKSSTEKIMTQDRKYSADIGAAEGGRDTRCAESLTTLNSELAAALEDTSTMTAKLKIAESNYEMERLKVLEYMELLQSKGEEIKELEEKLAVSTARTIDVSSSGIDRNDLGGNYSPSENIQLETKAMSSQSASSAQNNLTSVPTTNVLPESLSKRPVISFSAQDLGAVQLKNKSRIRVSKPADRNCSETEEYVEYAIDEFTCKINANTCVDKEQLKACRDIQNKRLSIVQDVSPDDDTDSEQSEEDESTAFD